MAPPGLRLALLLLPPPLLLSAVSLAAPGYNSTRFDFEVHPTSENWVILVNKEDWNGSLKDQLNNQTTLKQCKVHSSMSGVLTYGSFENITKIFHCLRGLIKEEISLDNCSLHFSYQNRTAHMECPCGNKNDSVSGSAGNSPPKRLVLVLSVVLPLCIVCIVLVGFALYFCCKDKLTLWFHRYFRKQPQGPTNERDGTHRRNISEMQRDLKDAENGQCNPEERHSLLLGGISDSSSNSTNSVVLELRPLNGTPGTPLPTPSHRSRNHS